MWSMKRSEDWNHSEKALLHLQTINIQNQWSFVMIINSVAVIEGVNSIWYPRLNKVIKYKFHDKLIWCLNDNVLRMYAQFEVSNVAKMYCFYSACVFKLKCLQKVCLMLQHSEPFCTFGNVDVKFKYILYLNFDVKRFEKFLFLLTYNSTFSRNRNSVYFLTTNQLWFQTLVNSFKTHFSTV